MAVASSTRKSVKNAINGAKTKVEVFGLEPLAASEVHAPNCPALNVQKVQRIPNSAEMRTGVGHLRYNSHSRSHASIFGPLLFAMCRSTLRLKLRCARDCSSAFAISIQGVEIRVAVLTLQRLSGVTTAGLFLVVTPGPTMCYKCYNGVTTRSRRAGIKKAITPVEQDNLS